MDVTTFIIAWIVSITAMTGFSSLWSTIAGVEFREPILLSKILTKDPDSTPEKNYQIVMGWVIHIIIGALFLGFYEILWNLINDERTFFWALIFGSVMGILGILGWVSLFRFTTNKVHINLTHYFTHLFIAHLVFSISAQLVYIFFN